MKKTMKLLSIFLALTLIIIIPITSCSNKNHKFKSYSKELNSQTFLNTDWGMSIDETLDALDLKIEDIEPYLWNVPMDMSKQYYKIKEKVSVNNLKSTVVLAFYDAPMSSVPLIDSISTYRNISKKYRDNYVGLIEVYVFPDEKDKDVIKQSFTKELGTKELGNFNENAIGMITNKNAYIFNCDDTKLIEKYLDIYKGSIFEKSIKQNEKHFLSYVKLQNYPNINSDNYLIIYSGLKMAFLNNVDRKISSVPDSKIKELLIEKDTMPKDKPTILEQKIDK